MNGLSDYNHSAAWRTPPFIKKLFGFFQSHKNIKKQRKMKILSLILPLFVLSNPIIDDDKFINRRSVAEEEKFDMFGEKMEISLK